MAWARMLRGPQAAGAVVDIGVVDGVGEEARHLAQLAAVLAEMRLPVGAGLLGSSVPTRPASRPSS